MRLFWLKPSRNGNGGGIITVQVNTLKQLAILLRHGGQQSFETLASTLIGSRWGGVQLVFKLFERSFACVSPAVKINNDRRKLDRTMRRYPPPSSAASPSQRLDETFLHHVFRQMRVAHALPCKTPRKCRFFSNDSSICFTAEFLKPLAYRVKPFAGDNKLRIL